MLPQGQEEHPQPQDEQPQLPQEPQPLQDEQPLQEEQPQPDWQVPQALQDEQVLQEEQPHVVFWPQQLMALRQEVLQVEFIMFIPPPSDWRRV